MSGRGKKVRPVFYEWLVVSMAMMFNVLISLVFLPVAFGLHWFVYGRDARGGWDSPMGSDPHGRLGALPRVVGKS